VLKLPDRRAEGAVIVSSSGWQGATGGFTVSETQVGKLKSCSFPTDEAEI